MRGNRRRSPRRALIEMGMRLLEQPDVHPREPTNRWDVISQYSKLFSPFILQRCELRLSPLEPKQTKMDPESILLSPL